MLRHHSTDFQIVMSVSGAFFLFHNILFLGCRLENKHLKTCRYLQKCIYLHPKEYYRNEELVFIHCLYLLFDKRNGTKRSQQNVNKANGWCKPIEFQQWD